MDAIKRMANEALVVDSVDLEIQLRKDFQGAKPLIWVVKAAKDAAAEAIVKMISVDPTKADEIRSLQNEIEIFRRIVRLVARIAIKGSEAEQLLNHEDHDDIVDMISQEIGALPGMTVDREPEDHEIN